MMSCTGVVKEVGGVAVVVASVGAGGGVDCSQACGGVSSVGVGVACVTGVAEICRGR